MGGLNSAVSFRKRQIQSKPFFSFFQLQEIRKVGATFMVVGVVSVVVGSKEDFLHLLL